MKLNSHLYTTMPAVALSLALAGMSAGCSNDFDQVTVDSTRAGVPIWITLSLAAPTGETTRAEGDSETAQEPLAESKINTVALILTDEAGVVKSAGAANKEDIKYDSETKRYSVKVLAGTSLTITEGSYRLYAVANAPKPVSGNGDYLYLMNHVGPGAGMMEDKIAYSGDGWIPEGGIPMATTDKDAVTVTFTDQQLETGFPYDDPYMVGVKAGTADRDVLPVTRLWSRIDFTGNTQFTIGATAVESGSGNESASGNETTTGNGDTGLTVTFIKACPRTIASEVYLMFRMGETSKVTLTPEFAKYPTEISSKSLSSGWEPATDGSTDPYAGTLWYLPEIMPAVSADGTSGVTYDNTTYIEFTAVLRPAEGSTALDPTIAGYLNGTTDADNNHPTLYYYDDGVFQSPLTTDYNRQVTSAPGNWHIVSWDKEADGYTVTYRRAIRNSTLADGEAAIESTDRDGKIMPGEYGLKRNTIYRISINSVSSLPHKTDKIETDYDLNITVTTPGQWTYHGTGSIF